MHPYMQQRHHPPQSPGSWSCRGLSQIRLGVSPTNFDGNLTVIFMHTSQHHQWLQWVESISHGPGRLLAAIPSLLTWRWFGPVSSKGAPASHPPKPQAQAQLLRTSCWSRNNGVTPKSQTSIIMEEYGGIDPPIFGENLEVYNSFRNIQNLGPRSTGSRCGFLMVS